MLAITLVAGPFYVRQAIAAFETVDANLIAASRTLGAGPLRTFFRVTLPLARGGLAAGEAISWRAGWASSARRSCSPAASRGRPRRCRSPSTGVRGPERPRHRARDQRAARDHQPRDPALAQGTGLWERSRLGRRDRRPEPTELVATLSTSFDCPCARSCSKLALEVEGTVALVGPSGRRQDVGAAGGRGARAARAAGSPSTRTSGSTRREGVFRKPDERRVGLVFQEYALFPHMNVRQNVAYAREEPGRRVPRAVPDLPPREGAADRALRRRAPARRARPRARPRPRRAAARRAALRARRPHQGRRARRAPGAPARVRAADAARHARLRGRGVAGRPGRRDRRRHAPPARVAAGARRAPRGRVRRVVHGGEPDARRRARSARTA